MIAHCNDQSLPFESLSIIISGITSSIPALAGFAGPLNGNVYELQPIEVKPSMQQMDIAVISPEMICDDSSQLNDNKGGVVEQHLPSQKKDYLCRLDVAR